MVVNVRLKNASSATVARGSKYIRINSNITTNKTKIKSLGRTTVASDAKKNNLSGDLHQGSRIHAQRKFAQGSNVASPAVTPIKDSKRDESRLRKRVISPTPPCLASKRPKTEDFLTFLCFRGTTVMPPDLDFFNYSTNERKDIKPLTSRIGNYNANSAFQGTSTAQPNSSSKKEKSPSPDKVKPATNSNDSGVNNNSSKGKASVKPVNGNSKTKTDIKATNVKSKKPCPVASKQNNKKDTKSNSTQKATTALNEQDARFAMTALKLKYQEKRLALSKSAITKITKKVKERSVILTRSKAKTEKSPSRSPTLVKPKIVKKKSSDKTNIVSRNLPSPDIIYGVNHSKSMAAKSSESENSYSSSDSSSKSESDSSEESEPEPVVKSLRSGKEFVMKPPLVKNMARKITTTRRMGTRAMHKTSKSPLRELPMYSIKNAKKKRLMKKLESRKEGNKAKIREGPKLKQQKSNMDKSKKSSHLKGKNEKLKEKMKADKLKVDKQHEKYKTGSIRAKNNTDKVKEKAKTENSKKVDKLEKSKKDRFKLDVFSAKERLEKLKEKKESINHRLSNKNQKIQKPLLKLNKTHNSKGQVKSKDLSTSQKKNLDESKKQDKTENEAKKKQSNSKIESNQMNRRKNDSSDEESQTSNTKSNKTFISAANKLRSKTQKDNNAAIEKLKKTSVFNKIKIKDQDQNSGAQKTIACNKNQNSKSRASRSKDYEKSEEEPLRTSKTLKKTPMKSVSGLNKNIIVDSKENSEKEESPQKASGKTNKKSFKPKLDAKMNMHKNTGNDEESEEEVKREVRKCAPKSKMSKKISRPTDSEESESEDEELKKKTTKAKNEDKSPKKDCRLSDSFGRPMRKTREAAEIYMGLLNKDFSSDDHDSSDISQDAKSDESGNTSSSETKFLEKQYHASLKRIEQKGRGSDVQAKNPKTKSTKVKLQSATKKVLSRPKKEQGPEKRVLRSQRTNSEDVKCQRTSITRTSKCSSPSPVARRRLTLPIATCDRRKEGAVRKSASICPRRPTEFSYSSSGSDHDTFSSSEYSDSSTSESDEKALAKNIEEIKRRSLEARRLTITAKKQTADTSDSEIDSSDDEFKASKSKVASATKPRNVVSKRRTSATSVAEDSKNIATEMRRLVEQKRAVEEGNAATAVYEVESEKQDTEMETETDQAEPEERSFSADDEQESTSESPQGSSSSVSSSSSSSADESENPQTPVEKKTIAVQVDLDLEDMEDAAAAAASASLSQTSRFTEISATVTHMTHAETSTSTHTHSHTTQHSHIDLGYCPGPEIPIPIPIIPPPIPVTQPPPPPLPPQSQPFQIPNYSRPDFYQSLHLAPPMVSSIQMVGHQGTQDFVSTHHLGIPVSMPMHSMVPLGPRLMNPNHPLCFSTTSITTAATLQTHIRSVAANLDIPLVRPMVGAENPLNLPLPIHLPRTHAHAMNTAHTQMTRPLSLWSNDGRSHYSAFRVPLPAGKIIQQQPLPPQAPQPASSCSSNIMMGSGQLPLSIVQPQYPHSNQSHLHMGFQHQQNQHSQHSTRVSLNPKIVPSQSSSYRPVVGSEPSTSSANVHSHGYSILHNLPNVSIVPKFDRNSKTVVSIPPYQSSSGSSKAKESKKSKIKKEKAEGSKKRKKIIIPQPSSPLTVRKDSTNPATYVKKSQKCKVKEAAAIVEPKLSQSDPFNKLLQLKKECHSGNESSCSSTQKRSIPTPETVLIEKRGSSTKDNPREERTGSNSKKTEKICGSSHGNAAGASGSNASTKQLKMEEVPVFYPSEEDFQDPLKYIDEIRKQAEVFGMAKIVPPRSFRPECNVEDDMRFTAYNHYIHKMFKRWGPNVQETAGIKKHLRNSNVDVLTPPLLGGMEVDLSTKLEFFGGLKEVIEKQKWHKVSDAMHFPKAANDRATKLDAIYVKYVLPYEMLSENERKKLTSSVEMQWDKRQKKQLKKDAENLSDSDSDDDSMQEFDDCVVKGKSTPLSSYFRVARNTFSMLFQGKDASCSDVESEYWKMVREGTRHLCVYSGSIDCAGVGWGFPLPKAGAKHPWNLKVLANSQGSALRSMGPVMGATVPTLHVAMVFTTYCWYRDPHSLPWIEYLHSGANKIWYSIPGAYEGKFRRALKELIPLQCKNKKLWLASDSAMVPPEMLLERGVAVARAVQNPGEFLIVFPKTFTSAICTGYLVSESVCFALPAWLNSCISVFKDIRESKEPPVFALEKLLLSIVLDNRASSEVLQMSLPLIEEILSEEYTLRRKLIALGLTTGKMGPNSDKVAKKKTKREEEHVHQCDTCNYILHLSIVSNAAREFDLCLPHALQRFSKTKSHIKGSVLLYDRTDEDLQSIVQGAKNRLEKRSS